MEPKVIKYQRGFLLTIAIVAVVVIGFIASMLVSMYTVTTRSTVNSLESTAAFYIARAGLEIATRDLVRPGTKLTCSSIGSNIAKYQNSCYPVGATGSSCIGQFSVTAVQRNPTGLALGGSVNTTQTTITLNSIAGLASPGVIVIDAEAIWYSTISGNQLLNVVRGTFGTLAATHTTTSTVTQDVCVLTATATVPNSNSILGKRVLQTTLWRDPNVHCLGTFPGCITPAFIGADDVSLSGGATISNPSVLSPQSTNYKGSTITCGGNLSVSSGGFYTYIDNISTPQSTQGNINGDIYTNDNDINSTSLWNLFFPGQTKSAVKASATVLSSANNNCTYSGITSATGIVWMDCTNTINMSASGGNVVIGSEANPVTFIVDSVFGFSNFQNLTIYGLTYFNNGSTISIPQNAKLIHEGLRASENDPCGGSGNMQVTFDYNALNNALFMSTPYSQYFMINEFFI